MARPEGTPPQIVEHDLFLSRLDAYDKALDGAQRASLAADRRQAEAAAAATASQVAGFAAGAACDDLAALGLTPDQIAGALRALRARRDVEAKANDVLRAMSPAYAVEPDQVGASTAPATGSAHDATVRITPNDEVN